MNLKFEIKNRDVSEEAIFARYPEIFRERSLPMNQTCMCWGLEVPDSWLPVIDLLCHSVESGLWAGVSQKTPDGRCYSIRPPQFVANQVKSKFNQLRFYYTLDYTKELQRIREEFGVHLEKVPEETHRSYERQISGMVLMAESMIDLLERADNEARKEVRGG
jgi:hypothetical protein